MRIRTLQKPMVARCLVAGLLSAAAALAQPLTESAVVTRALARGPLREQLDAPVGIERGRRQSAASWANPALSYSREQTFGALGSGEDYLSIGQLVDVSGRRGLLGAAGDARVRAAQASAEVRRREVVFTARLSFHELLMLRARAQAVDAWLARVDEALVIVVKREARGDAALWDRRRLERERAVAQARRDQAAAAIARAEARLAALLEGPVGELDGRLLPGDEPAALELLLPSLERHPAFEALSAQASASADEARAWSRWWAPDVKLELGWKGVELGAQGRSDGFLVGASLALPAWERNGGALAVARGETAAVQAALALRQAELRGELTGAHAEAARLRRVAVAFEHGPRSASAELIRIATAGYAGGELGLLELLDASRGAADDALMSLELAFAARRARLEVDLLTGVNP